MSMEILASLVHKGHVSMTIETGSKCVTIKYHTNRSLGTGPSLVIGENGGFQWLGNPSDISESLSSIFSFMNNNMKSEEFIRVIPRSNSMVKYIYPSGIKRTKQVRNSSNKSNLRDTPLQF